MNLVFVSVNPVIITTNNICCIKTGIFIFKLTTSYILNQINFYSNYNYYFWPSIFYSNYFIVYVHPTSVQRIIAKVKILLPSYPTLIPSSMSVGATWSPKSTTNLANCLTLIMYLGSSESALMILVHLATCRGCSSVKGKKHVTPVKRPVNKM